MNVYCAQEGKKKKKGEPQIPLTHMPAKYTTLATFHMALEQLLHGDDKVEMTFSQHVDLDLNDDADASPTLNRKVHPTLCCIVIVNFLYTYLLLYQKFNKCLYDAVFMKMVRLLIINQSLSVTALTGIKHMFDYLCI